MGKLIDLTGLRFGRLVVIERDEDHIKPSGKKIPAWKCMCDCGNIVTVGGTYLRTGTTRSCGCLRQEVVSEYEDLSGQKFGKLTVIKRIKKEDSSAILWLCQCDCGNEKIAESSKLKKKITRSCGCDLAEDLTGLRFGKLKVIKRAGSKNGDTAWLCKCDCGNEKIVSRSVLKYGATRGCGCSGTRKDITGKRFGKLVAIRPAGYDNGYIWECKCDCGNVKNVPLGRLVSGNTKSCGCSQYQTGITRNYVHGLAKTRIYQIWINMIERCNNEKSTSYENYGGRGIAVCDEWSGENGILNFYDWSMENGYQDNLTIDRIDNNGDYCPENCRWVSVKEQANNRRSNILIDYQGEVKTLAQWCDYFGLKYKLVHQRLRRGVPLNELFEPPKR